LLKVGYESLPTKLLNPSIEISIYNSDTLIYSTNTFFTRLNLNFNESGEFNILIEKLNLIEGAFHISVVVLGDNNQIVYDWKDKEYEFHVQKSNSDTGLVPLSIKFENI
jgi:hypothetical protein